MEYWYYKITIDGIKVDEQPYENFIVLYTKSYRQLNYDDALSEVGRFMKANTNNSISHGKVRLSESSEEEYNKYRNH